MIRHQIPRLIAFFDENSNNGEDMLLGIQSVSYPSPTDFNICMEVVCNKINLEEEFMGVRLNKKSVYKGKLFVNIINDFCADNKVYKYLLEHESKSNTVPIYELCNQYLSNKETLFHLKDIFTEDTLDKVIGVIDSAIPSWVYDKILQFSPDDFKMTFETNKLFKLAFLVSKEDAIIRELIPVAISEYLNTEIVSPELLLFQEVSDLQKDLYFCFQITNNEDIVNNSAFELLEDQFEGLAYVVEKKKKSADFSVQSFMTANIHTKPVSDTNGLPDRRRPTRIGG